MELKYQIQGQGQDILLLHGWGGSMQSLLPLSEALVAKGYRCINLEWPGAGDSPVPAKALELNDYAHILKRTVDKLDLTDPVALGHSFGGKVLLQTALIDPLLFSKLIIIDASGIKPKNDLKKKIFNGLSVTASKFENIPGFKKIKKDLRYAYYRLLVKEMDYFKSGAMSETFKNIIAVDLDEELNRIEVPTLLIWGAKDKITPLWMGKKMNSLIKGSMLKVVEETGHGLPLVAAEQVSEIVYNYLHKPDQI